MTEEKQLLDKYGKCPHCGESWDGGDIVEVLKDMDIYSDYSLQKIKKIAEECFGYTDQNKKHFSKILSISPLSLGSEDKPNYHQCPKCREKFNSEDFKN